MWIQRLTSAIKGEFPGRISIRVRFTFPSVRCKFGLVWFVWCSVVVNANSANLETVESGFECLRHLLPLKGRSGVHLFHYIDTIHAEYMVRKPRRGY